jgi:hypothetical protein
MTTVALRRRLAVQPFEAAIAALLLISGAAGLARYGITDPTAALLPAWEAVSLNVVLAATGLLILAGIARAWRAGEAAGMLFLTGVIAARFLLFGYYLGFGPAFVVTGVFDLAVIWAAIARLLAIRRHQVIVLASPAGDVR